MQKLNYFISGILMLFCCVPVFGQKREVAVTFDDLPGVSMVRYQRCNLRDFEDVNGRLLKSLKEQKVPALGLVVFD